MLTIIRLTFREVLSKKIFYMVLVLTFLFLIVYGIGLHFTVAEMQQHMNVGFQKVLIFPQLLSLALYFSTFIVASMAVFSTVGAISGEIETGTIQAVIPKPIRRREFILGKFLGYSMMMSMYSAFLYFAVILITKFITDYIPGDILFGAGLFVLIPIILTALSLSGSVLFSTMANGITVFMLFIIGTVGGMMEQIGAGIKNTALVNIGILSSLVIPSDALYRKMIYGLLTGANNPINVFTAAPFASKNPPSDIMVVYALIYLAVVILIGVRVFGKKDI